MNQFPFGKNVVLILFCLMTFNGLYGQAKISWDDLAAGEWKEELDTTTLMPVQTVTFDSTLSLLQGKEVIISGYVIPLDAMGFSYALSANSFAACFFCGQAGPETVLELKVTPKSIRPYEQKTELLTFKGILILKETNPQGFNVILSSARRMKL